MKDANRSRMLVGAFGLAMFLSGCGEDNQKEAKIEGPAPTDNLTTEERLKQRQRQGPAQADPGGQAYPGANRRPKGQ